MTRCSCPSTFSFDKDGRAARLGSQGVLETEVEPIKNPVTGAPHRIQVVMPEGFEHIAAEVASANIRSPARSSSTPRARTARWRTSFRRPRAWRPERGTESDSRVVQQRVELMLSDSALEQILRHDRLIVAIGMPRWSRSPGPISRRRRHGHEHGRYADGPRAVVAGPRQLVFVMWWVMMIAMMVPSAAPMVLLFATIKRKQATATAPYRSWMFLAGYLVIWAGFSLVAIAVQWALERPGCCPA